MKNKLFKNPDPKVFCKFGVTHKPDVLDRFNPDIFDGYTKSEKYLDWDIKVEFSMWFETEDEARAYEKYWLEEKFSKTSREKVWVEKVLECPTMDYYTEATGISELRLLTEKQRKWVLWQLYSKKEEYNAESV
jgi:hypothetical protein